MINDKDYSYMISLVESLISTENPIAGVLFNMGKGLVNFFNAEKIKFFIKGFSSDDNIDDKITQLLRCIELSEQNQILIANLFRKVSNAESPKVCVIYGLIISNHLEDKFDISHEELIVCKALESATDFDLINFKIIMEKYIKKDIIGRKVDFYSELEPFESYISTCDWCVYNRVFKTLPAEYLEEDENVIFETQYCVTKAADILFEYLKRAKILWEEDKTL